VKVIKSKPRQKLNLVFGSDCSGIKSRGNSRNTGKLIVTE